MSSKKIKVLFFFSMVLIIVQIYSGNSNSIKAHSIVKGVLKVDNEVHRLSYFFHWEESSVIEKGKNLIFLVFSDQAIPENQQDSFYLGQLGRAGKIHAVLVKYSPDKKCLMGGNLYHNVYGRQSIAFGGGLFKAIIALKNETVLVGRITTDGWINMFGHRWNMEVDFKFNAKKGRNSLEGGMIE